MSNMHARIAGKLVATFVNLKIYRATLMLTTMPEAVHRGPFDKALTLSQEEPWVLNEGQL